MNRCNTLWLLLWMGSAVSLQSPGTFSLSDDVPSEPSSTATDKDLPEAKVPVRRTQWLMFTASWCQPCAVAKHDFETWLRRSGWIVDHSDAAHIRLIDGDTQPDLIQQHEVTQYPTFILVRDGDVLFRQTGYPGRQQLVSHYQQAVASSHPIVGAVSVGTLKGQRDNITQLIATLRPVLKDGGTLTLRLDHMSAKSALLPLGDQWSIGIDSPVVMHFTLKNDQLTCRFDDPLPRARLAVGIPLEQAVSSVTVTVSEVLLELPRAPDVRLRVEP